MLKMAAYLMATLSRSHFAQREQMPWTLDRIERCPYPLRMLCAHGRGKDVIYGVLMALVRRVRALPDHILAH